MPGVGSVVGFVGGEANDYPPSRPAKVDVERAELERNQLRDIPAKGLASFRLGIPSLGGLTVEEFRASKIKPETRAWLDTVDAEKRRIRYDEYVSFGAHYGCNSWEQEEVFKRLDNIALLQVIKHSLENCAPRDRGPAYPCGTYDEAIIHYFTPLLSARLEEAINAGHHD